MELKIWKLKELEEKELPAWLESEFVNLFSQTGNVAPMKGELRVKQGHSIYSRSAQLEFNQEARSQLSKIIADFRNGKRGLLANFAPTGLTGWCLVEVDGLHFIAASINKSDVIEIYETIVLRRGPSEVFVTCSDSLLLMENKPVAEALAGSEGK